MYTVREVYDKLVKYYKYKGFSSRKANILAIQNTWYSFNNPEKCDRTINKEVDYV